MSEAVLDEETKSNLSRIPNDLKRKWSKDGVWNPCSEKYSEKTVVRSGEDAVNAFEKYTEYFKHVINSWSPSSDTAVFVPCGSQKPIGSSTIHQKKVKAIRNGGLEEADIIVISEPCTVVPPEYRLSIPAANYDFPPEYTEKGGYPEVFEVFTDRLAEWIDEMGYDRIYTYLIEGHQNKFASAKEKMDTSPTIYNIPSASYNTETESYSGDRFKKQEEMDMKVRAVLKYRAGHDVDLPDDYAEFYSDKF